MPLSGIEKQGAPLNNQIELCIFGKGFGECITIHLGNNQWVIIDSFLNFATKRPIALEYLESLSVDASRNVCLVVATHWHDDHIRGIYEIVKKADNARFVCSQALTNCEFQKFVKRHQTNLMTSVGSKVDEINNIFEFFLSKPENRKYKNPCMASEGKILFELLEPNNSIPLGCKILSLSPSDADVFNFMKNIANMMPENNTPKRSAKRISENQASVVMHVGYGNICLLLGSDMENNHDIDSGWDAIINSDVFSLQKSVIYKVPHHGSVTGHNDRIWEGLLLESPLSVVTPFVNGRVQLPTKDQINSIMSKSLNLLATGLPSNVRNKKRDASVEKEIKSANIKLKPLGAGLGAIRLRSMPLTEAREECHWCVELFGSAVHLA